MDRIAILPAIFLLAVGCAGTRTRDEQPPLPFHVAVVPIKVAAVERDTPIEGKETELRLALEGSEISSAFAESLSGTFTRVSLLDYPSDVSPEDFGKWSPSRTDAHWVQEAVARKADVILEGTLVYDPDVFTSANDRFWPNFLLFSLGGPMTWFVNDRSYFLDVLFEVQVHDLNPIGEPDRDATMQNRNSRLDSFAVELPEVTTDFLDRATGGSYAVSLVCPSGLLSVESDEAKAYLEEVLVEQLSVACAEKIRNRRNELIRASGLVDFHPEDFRVVQSATGLELQGDLVLELGEVDRMGGYRYRYDGGAFVQEASFRQGQLDESGRYGRMRFPVRIPLEGGEGHDTVQIEVRDGSLAQNKRTFTFSLRDQREVAESGS